jgi:hypothetical protein
MGGSAEADGLVEELAAESESESVIAHSQFTIHSPIT